MLTEVPYRAPEHDEIVNEIATRLQNQVSKLQSQRLHLQGLIAKRDRLDYEIKTLKQVIRRTKQVSTRRDFSLREEARKILEEAEPRNEIQVVPESIYEGYLEKIEVELERFRAEEDRIEMLSRLPRLED